MSKYYDPPQGWLYGFPKKLPEPIPKGEDMKKWLVDNGYPEEKIKDIVYARIVEIDDE